MNLTWYVHRLRGMSAAEIAARIQVAATQRYWAKPERRPDPRRALLGGSRVTTVSLPRRLAREDAASNATIAAADRYLAGSWPIFHLTEAPVATTPDWFTDPLTGQQAPRTGYAFTIPYRDESKVGNIKFVWELSRHQATTILATAWWLTRREVYAVRAAEHLTSWWRENPFLTGVHWVSAIEVGLRLLSWTWIRALLGEWHGVSALFDENPVFIAQLYHHQVYAYRFHSRGSSANNHLIAELAGLSAAATIFPWFADSARWAAWSRAKLVEQAVAQTHDDGLNREQASEYHLFVMEMLLAAALPARMSGRPFPSALDEQLRRMADALAASLDTVGRPPRFGDGDEGRGVLLDAPEADQTAILLDTCRSLYGAPEWWPPPGGSVLGQVAAHLADAAPAPRDVVRGDHFPGAGMTILRAGTGDQEVWVRCDAGPHGFLSIAAHGHADALSIEVRYGGTDILADPGTYCYHGEPAWRGYFKGTTSHNTLRVDNTDQAVNGGPFLWLTRPTSALDKAIDSPARSWQAHHDGYRRLPDPVVHHRQVDLNDDTRGVTIRDWIEAATTHDVALAWHLGPSIDVELDGSTARLTWHAGHAILHLPPELAWSVHHGEQEPPLGWYSRGFGHKVEASVLVGRGRLAAGVTLQTLFSP